MSGSRCAQMASRCDAYPTHCLGVPRAGQPLSHGVHQRRLSSTHPHVGIRPRHSVLLDEQNRAHLFNRGRIVPVYRKAHQHRRDRCRRACVHEWIVCGEASRWQKASWMSATPLIVTRLRLDGGLGVDRESDCGRAVTLVTSSRSGKGTPTGVGRR